ncbi:hypothetical protein QL285_042159 [Trifolium repens]|nr:hypothetical protein QL285_042159 [Trifolium repens]
MSSLILSFLVHRKCSTCKMQDLTRCYINFQYSKMLLILLDSSPSSCGHVAATSHNSYASAGSHTMVLSPASAGSHTMGPPRLNERKFSSNYLLLSELIL